METVDQGIEIFSGDRLSNEILKAWLLEMTLKGKFEIIQICISGNNPVLAVHYKLTTAELKKESTRRASQNGTSNPYAIGGGLRSIRE